MHRPLLYTTIVLSLVSLSHTIYCLWHFSLICVSVCLFSPSLRKDLKQKMYNEAIQDCDKCLQIEATNVKAMLRKCDALIACHNKNEAYRLYMKLLQIDPENVIAKKALKNISIRYIDYCYFYMCMFDFDGIIEKYCNL